jgi:1-acyl-sn-glycerol-3-phosphate acyltransferase
VQLTRVRSFATTVVLWVYFIGAFVAGYWVAFVVAGLLLGRRGLAWGLGSYSRGFFALLGLLIPRLRLDVPQRRDLRRTRGTVVVCNHISFLDPLLLLSLLPRTITIVRPDFLRVPIFGWLLRGAGFLGPDLFAEGQPWVERVARHLRGGGNLLIFPEGTRSRGGSLAPFKKGAFYLARVLAAPILVLRVRGTNHLFAPGRLIFDTSATEPVEVRRLAAISAADADAETTHELAQRVRGLYEATGTRPSC